MMAQLDPVPKTPRPTGGGFLFVAALLTGLVIGVVRRQPTLGFLIGAAVGIVILIALWLLDRRRGVDR